MKANARAIIYGVALALCVALALATTVGWVTQEQVLSTFELVLTYAGALAGVAGSVLALRNLTPDK